NFAEPFGLSMIAVMACGTSVIACGRGSGSEIIRHEETDFIGYSSDEIVAGLSQVRGLQRAWIRQPVADNLSQECMVIAISMFMRRFYVWKPPKPHRLHPRLSSVHGEATPSLMRDTATK